MRKHKGSFHLEDSELEEPEGDEDIIELVDLADEMMDDEDGPVEVVFLDADLEPDFSLLDSRSQAAEDEALEDDVFQRFSPADEKPSQSALKYQTASMSGDDRQGDILDEFAFVEGKPGRAGPQDGADLLSEEQEDDLLKSPLDLWTSFGRDLPPQGGMEIAGKLGLEDEKALNPERGTVMVAPEVGGGPLDPAAVTGEVTRVDAGAASPPDGSLDGFVAQIEARLVETIREIVESRLPDIVRSILQEEIARLKKEMNQG